MNRSKLNACQKSIIRMLNTRMITESEVRSVLIVLNEARGMKSPQDVKDFVKKNEQKIKQTEAKMKGKEKSFFRKAYDFVMYACGKGMKFIGDHWLDIIKLVGIIILGIFSYRLYCLAMPQIEKLFTGAADRVKKATKQANTKLDMEGNNLEKAVDNVTSAVDDASAGHEQIKQRMMNKVADEFMKDGGGAYGRVNMNKAADEIRQDPIAARKSVTRGGNIALMR